MMRGKPASSMQKTYDDCYLICSTAVYFESQNNEAEALRSWRNALDQIYYHNAYRIPSGWRPRTETERALQESLRQMELQCKERVDLLEALRASRAEAEKEGSTTSSIPEVTVNGRSSNSNLAQSNSTQQTTSSPRLGQDSIPALEYNDIARTPALPPRPPPKRPSYISKKSSNTEIPKTQSSQASSSLPSVALSPPTATLGPHAVNPNRKSSRTPSPEKRGGMLRTLRQGGKERTSSGKLATSLRSKPPAAAKAATQAWGTTQRGSLGSIEQALGDSNGGSSTAAATAWDPYTRTLVERPPSRDRPSSRDNLRPNPMTRSTSDLPVRTATPSDLNRKQDDTHAERGRQYDRSPPYPDFPVMSPPQLSNPFERSSEDLQASGIPDPKSSPPRVPLHAEPASSKTKFRKQSPARLKKPELPSYRKEYPPAPPSKYKKPPNAAPPRQFTREPPAEASASSAPFAQHSNPKMPPKIPRKAVGVVSATAERQRLDNAAILAGHSTEETLSSEAESAPRRRPRKAKEAPPQPATPPSSDDANDSDSPEPATPSDEWQKKVEHLMKHLPKGVDEAAAKQIFNEIVIQGDEVHWSDVAGLDIAKSALKETVVYPFLRPDLFMGLREPARGMLLFGPPGTGKTMLARAVATESRSTFFAISASSLTSKYLGESEKLVRALFAIAKALAPSIIFVDEIDSLLSARGGGSEHEATRRIKTEFLIQWSDLAKAAAGRETSERDKERGDASRVLVLAATNLPWAIDEAARRRFVRRQYIPLPEDWVRKQQLATLLSHQKHELGERELDELVVLTEGFSGSDITALAKDAAMGPLRSLGEKLLDMSPEDIRPIRVADFRASLVNIRPSVSKAGLKEFEDWAKEFGERGG